MTLHALDYACVTDDVVVKDFACTSTGRIFFAGDDEALYEVEYSAGDTWRARRCRKTCHHSATPKLLPSILRLRAPDALRQVLVDEDRCALYTRSDSGVVAVYDLGAAPPMRPDASRRCATSPPPRRRRGGGLFYDGRGATGAHGYAPYGAQSFGGGGGDRTSGTSGKGSQTRKGGRLVHVAVVSARESATATLVAVCADGRRVYFTALPSAGHARYGPQASARTGTRARTAPAPARTRRGQRDTRHAAHVASGDAPRRFGGARPAAAGERRAGHDRRAIPARHHHGAPSGG